MREIKFRGQALYGTAKGGVKKGDFVYGSFVGASIVRQGSNVGMPVDTETVGQYTGVKTYDGVEVYEGDHLYDGELDYDYVVKYDEGEFRAVDETCLQCLADVLADPFVENLGFDEYSKKHWNEE